MEQVYQEGWLHLILIIAGNILLLDYFCDQLNASEKIVFMFGSVLKLCKKSFVFS